jgi:hypothetical protein
MGTTSSKRTYDKQTDNIDLHKLDKQYHLKLTNIYDIFKAFKTAVHDKNIELVNSMIESYSDTLTKVYYCKNKDKCYSPFFDLIIHNLEDPAIKIYELIKHNNFLLDGTMQADSCKDKDRALANLSREFDYGVCTYVWKIVNPCSCITVKPIVNNDNGTEMTPVSQLIDNIINSKVPGSEDVDITISNIKYYDNIFSLIKNNMKQLNQLIINTYIDSIVDRTKYPNHLNKHIFLVQCFSYGQMNGIHITDKMLYKAIQADQSLYFKLFDADYVQNPRISQLIVAINKHTTNPSITSETRKKSVDIIAQSVLKFNSDALESLCESNKDVPEFIETIAIALMKANKCYNWMFPLLCARNDLTNLGILWIKHFFCLNKLSIPSYFTTACYKGSTEIVKYIIQSSPPLEGEILKESLKYVLDNKLLDIFTELLTLCSDKTVEVKRFTPMGLLMVQACSFVKGIDQNEDQERIKFITKILELNNFNPFFIKELITDSCQSVKDILQPLV